VTISTKFGIEPLRRTTALGVGLYFGRRIVRLLPALRGFLQRGTQSLVKSGAFSVQQAQVSLETSLRELSTDHIDFYLLHDYIVSEKLPDELLAFLEDSVKAARSARLVSELALKTFCRLLSGNHGCAAFFNFKIAFSPGTLTICPGAIRIDW